MRRVLMVVCALAMPAAGVLAFASTSSAATFTGVTCTKLSGTFNPTAESASGKLTGCTKSYTGDSGTFSGALATESGTTKWANKGVTTFEDLTGTASSGCPGSDLTYVITGTVEKSTGKAKGITKGSDLSATLCINVTKSTVTLEKKTKFEIEPAVSS